MLEYFIEAEYTVKKLFTGGPVFTFCPGDKTVYTNLGSSKVWWDEPTAVDHRGNRLQMSSDNSAGDVFLARRQPHQVTYYATDSLGRRVVCAFNVSVLNEGKYGTKEQPALF